MCENRDPKTYRDGQGCIPKAKHSIKRQGKFVGNKGKSTGLLHDIYRPV